MLSLGFILAMTAAVAASMGYFAARKPGEGDEKDPDEPADDADAKPKEKEPGKKGSPAAAKDRPSPFATLPFSLGDVVSSGAEERWLAGAIVAREGGRVIGALFLAPEGAQQKAVAAFAPPRTDVYWMSPAELASPDEPPATIELAGAALDRKGRLPVTLERLGQGAPSVADDGLWAVYDRSGRDVAIVIASAGKAHAWVGTRLEEHEYDRLGGGGD